MGWRLKALSQGGVIQFHQLLELGVTRAECRRLLERGELVRLARGLYSLPDPADPWLQRVRATLAVVGPDAVVWRRSAARWWGLDGLDQTSIVELAVGASGRRGDPTVARVERHLQVTRHRGLAVTTIGQTLVDLGPVAGPDLVERAMEDGLRRGAVDLAGLRRLAKGAPRASAVLQAVLARRPEGAAPTESDAETLFVQLVRRGGLPEPVRQLAVVVRGRRARLDFAWPGAALAAEVDGARFHGDDALGRDLRRQNAVLLAGWHLVRFTWLDVARYPDQVIDVLREYLS